MGPDTIIMKKENLNNQVLEEIQQSPYGYSPLEAMIELGDFDGLIEEDEA